VKAGEVQPRRKYWIAFALLLFGLSLYLGSTLLKASSDVAFLGDSITQGWFYPSVNLGIYGNTTEQMGKRLQAQLPAHSYKRVVIMGGTNDILRGVDSTVTLRNLTSIATLTAQSGAQPVLCEITPIFHSFNPADTTDYSAQVHDLNEKIVQLASAHNWKLIDYYHPMVGHPSFSSDGVHMKWRGYMVMEWAYLRETHSS
jgi:lysophospholipase L1-like esterase